MQTMQCKALDQGSSAAFPVLKLQPFYAAAHVLFFKNFAGRIRSKNVYFMYFKYVHFL